MMSLPDPPDTLARLSLTQRTALEAEIDTLLEASFGEARGEAEDMEALAKTLDRGLNAGGTPSPRVKMLAKLLRRRAMAARTARLTGAY